MSGPNDSSAPTGDREILITRTFDAPPELVWRAWVDPGQVVQWWGPNGFKTTTHAMDVRPGGEWRFDMHGPDGRNYPNRICFDEVVEAQRLVYRHVGEADVEPVSFRTKVLFQKHELGTKLTMRMEFPTREERDRVNREYGAVQGGIQTVGRLAGHLAKQTGRSRAALTIALPSDREIIMNRVLNAPRQLVWDAMTKPEMIRNWLFLPEGWSMSRCDEDVRVGGAYRWEWNGPDGKAAMAMHGFYREVVPPGSGDAGGRLVRTETFEFGCQPQAGEQVATLEFREHEGRTSMTTTVLYPSKEARNGMIASGMERGVSAGFDKLEAMLAKS